MRGAWCVVRGAWCVVRGAWFKYKYFDVLLQLLSDMFLIKKIHFIFLFILVWTNLIISQDNISNLFNRTGDFLSTYIFEDGVDYGEIIRNPAELDTLLEALSNIDTLQLDTPEKQKVFWINAYNLFVIDIVVRNYPLKSIVELDGFFTRFKRNFAGEDFTLTQIRDEKLFKIDRDLRIDFALMIPAVSSPAGKLLTYEPEQISKQLDLNMENVLNNNSMVNVDSLLHKIGLNKIFKWYEYNLKGEESSVIPFINKYRKIRIPRYYVIDFLPFDWHLNDHKTKGNSLIRDP